MLEHPELSLDTTWFDLSSPEIDKNMRFGTLEVGKYLYRITATVSCAYSPDGKNLYFSETTRFLHNSEFSVVDKITCSHSYQDAVTAPTCTEQGYTTHTCSSCGYSYVDNYVAPTGHNHTTVVTDPTCIEPGYTAHICIACGDTYIDSYVEAKGHSYIEAGYKAPTATEDGYQRWCCIYCGYEDIYTIPATGGVGTLGDVNGDGEINVIDAMRAAQYIVGDIGKDDINLLAADVNNDNEIDVLDAMRIAQYIVGDIGSFG